MAMIRATIPSILFELFSRSGFTGRTLPLTSCLTMRQSAIQRSRYRGGVDTQLNALDADRDLFQAELALAQLRYNELVSVVQLSKALGGGWQS
ncbi:MAG: efflux system, outer rane lipoprotein NodT family [Bryobacterales bacterium]|jgi:hypothetical protein|nr:efflux system, outer rane lipoprotein NodT family [Bryobacterales bacterium]